MGPQRHRLRYLLRDEPASSLQEWKRLCPLEQMADLEECFEYIMLELKQASIRIGVVREQFAYIRRMRELDAMSGENVLTQYFDPDPEEPGDNGGGGKRA